MKHWSINVKGILCVLMILFLGRLEAQPPLSLGLGLSTSIYLLDKNKPYPVPTLPLSPYITVKLKRHEVLAGPDLYLPKESSAIGVQAAYRYHLRKGSREFDPFVEANFQFVKFRPKNVSSENFSPSTSFAVRNGSLIGYQTFVNTCGIGLKLNIQDEIMFYSVFGGGFTYRQQTIIYNQFQNRMSDENLICFAGYIRIGASLFFYRKK